MARRPPGLWAFVPLAAAAHLAAFAVWPRGPEGGANGAGEGGFDAVSLAGADGPLADLVAEWERPPEATATLAPSLAPPATEAAPEGAAQPASAPTPPPELAPPDLAPAAPRADAPPAPVAAPEPPPKPKAAPKPAAKAPKLAKPAPKAGGAPQLRAAGEGGGAVAGQNGTASEGSVSPGERRSALKEWGGKIRAKVERSRRQAAGGGAGRVVLALTVARDGRLVSAAIAESSGNAALDAAALQAARRAGRFAAAPSTLTDASYPFTLPLLFKR